MSSWKALNETAKLTRLAKSVNFAEEFNPGHKCSISQQNLHLCNVVLTF